MVNVVNTIKCIEPECSITPIFNNPGSKKAIYCSSHKKTGMIDIKSKKCEYNGCKKKTII